MTCSSRMRLKKGSLSIFIQHINITPEGNYNVKDITFSRSKCDFHN